MNDVANDRVGRMANPPHEWQGWSIREHGVGKNWLGYCRSLDADAGELGSCAGSLGPDSIGMEEGDTALMISPRTKSKSEGNRTLSSIAHQWWIPLSVSEKPSRS